MQRTKKTEVLVGASNNNNTSTITTTITTCTSPNQLENNEITSSLQHDGRFLFSGEPVICQLIQATNLFQKLTLKDILSLTFTSQQIFKQLSPLISNRYFLHYHDNTNIQHYHPKKLFITTPNLEKLFDDPFLSNVYKIKFTQFFDFRTNKLPDS
eukprot:TRINITY_DN1662_c0_g1_i9.p1 TRINITY_DN1662_c0_g1~~TRINITY_DN1662_c0_g1_i9.p1  ORF type:complete len:155 (-),score=43.98 TRINITY_DN1662_c0_g1_i9:588-1052(-)